MKTRLVIRRLPPTLSIEQLEEALQPWKDCYNELQLHAGKVRKFPNEPKLSHAYLHFGNSVDLQSFYRDFDGHLFLDSSGKRYKALVEFAFFQWQAGVEQKDSREDKIFQDEDYIRFLNDNNYPLSP